MVLLLLSFKTTRQKKRDQTQNEYPSKQRHRIWPSYVLEGKKAMTADMVRMTFNRAFLELVTAVEDLPPEPAPEDASASFFCWDSLVVKGKAKGGHQHCLGAFFLRIHRKPGFRNRMLGTPTFTRCSGWPTVRTTTLCKLQLRGGISPPWIPFLLPLCHPLPLT